MVKKIFITSLIVVLIDQITKFLTQNINLQILPFIRLIDVKNTGAAFGILKDHTILLIFLSIMIIGFLIYYIDKIEEKDYIAYGLILGGAFGNLIDRIFLNYVRDFISIWVWPVFNIADAAISIGLIIIIYNEIKKKKKLF